MFGAFHDVSSIVAPIGLLKCLMFMQPIWTLPLHQDNYLARTYIKMMNLGYKFYLCGLDARL